MIPGIPGSRQQLLCNAWDLSACLVPSFSVRADRKDRGRSHPGSLELVEFTRRFTNFASSMQLAKAALSLDSP